MPKNGGFRIVLVISSLEFANFRSLNEVLRDLRNHVRPFVCPFVRPSVTQFLKNLSLLFSETLQLVRACKREKNIPSAFLKKNPVLPLLAKNCPKLAILAQNAKNGGFSLFFLQSVY